MNIYTSDPANSIIGYYLFLQFGPQRELLYLPVFQAADQTARTAEFLNNTISVWQGLLDPSDLAYHWV